MPTLGESIDKLLGIKPKEETPPENKPGEDAPTAEQIRDMTIQATISNLKERGLLVDKPTAGTNQPDGTAGDNVTWATIDVSTEAGAKQFDDFMASEAGQKRYQLPA